MITVFLSLFTLILLCDSSIPLARESASKKADMLHPVIIMKTNMGTIEIMLDAEKAPVTVKNFLSYVNEAYYDSTIFHRVIPNFMVQGGGYMTDMTAKPTRPPIKNEAANGLSNKRGTIAMARTQKVDSATSQFFINHKDNDYLDHKDNTPDRYGYAVFGMVTKGMDVVDSIATVKTMRDVPVNPVVIESVRVKE